jgi:transcriptional regulator with XRE-family HTH domain
MSSAVSGGWEVSEYMSAGYAERVGERLRNVRRQRKQSLQAVESSSNNEFKASVLGAYERGERAISVPRLQRLAKFYSVPVDQLLPKDTGPEPVGRQVEVDLRTDSADPLGGEQVKFTIDLTQLDSATFPEKELLARYLSMIRVQRQDFNGRVLTIRREDFRAIACMLNDGPEQMRVIFEELGLKRI